MSLTLNELKIVQKVIRQLEQIDDEESLAVAEQVIEREIKLKETDFIRMIDAQGNPIENDGN